MPNFDEAARFPDEGSLESYKCGPGSVKRGEKLDKSGPFLSNLLPKLDKTSRELDKKGSFLNETVTVSFKRGDKLSKKLPKLDKIVAFLCNFGPEMCKEGLKKDALF